MNTLIVLGSGTSTGIPTANGDWGVCDSTNPKNTRLRSSVLLTIDTTNILIDTTPDLRTQTLKYGIKNIDATIITHDHADHLHGLDDLRPFCFGPPPRTIPVFTSTECKKIMIERFPYIFNRNPNHPPIGGGIPNLALNEVSIDQTQVILGHNFEFFNLPHGYGQTLGLCHKSFAYLIDCHEVPSRVIENLQNKNLDLLIIDCVQKDPHKTHLNLSKTFDYIRKIGPKRAGLIHMGNKIDHAWLENECHQEFGSNVFPVYDGLILNYSN